VATLGRLCVPLWYSKLPQNFLRHGGRQVKCPQLPFPDYADLFAERYKDEITQPARHDVVECVLFLKKGSIRCLT
jgi:hypothetical protein